MTDEQLQAIKARCETATPGPWIWESCAGKRVRLWTKSSVDYVLEQARDLSGMGWLDMEDNDAGFIAHSREDMSALLAEVARLYAELDALRKKHDPAEMEQRFIHNVWGGHI